VKNKLTSVFPCVFPLIDHEFRHNIVKIAVDPRGDSLVDPQTTYFDNVMLSCYAMFVISHWWVSDSSRSNLVELIDSLTYYSYY